MSKLVLVTSLCSSLVITVFTIVFMRSIVAIARATLKTINYRYKFSIG